MTGDDHANGGTAGRFDQHLADSPAGCSVAELGVRAQHVVHLPEHAADQRPGDALRRPGLRDRRSTSTPTAPTSPRPRWTPSMPTQLARLARPSTPACRRRPPSGRTASSGATGRAEPKAQLSNGMRLDTNYYYWPPSWVDDRPGFFTGSGMPMRFADTDGTFIDVYQATTQMTDESGRPTRSPSTALLDRAARPAGLLRRLHRQRAHRRRLQPGVQRRGRRGGQGARRADRLGATDADLARRPQRLDLQRADLERQHAQLHRHAGGRRRPACAAWSRRRRAPARPHGRHARRQPGRPTRPRRSRASTTPSFPVTRGRLRRATYGSDTDPADRHRPHVPRQRRHRRRPPARR